MGFVQFLLKGEWTLSRVPVSNEVDEASEHLSWPELVQSFSGVWADFPDVDEIRQGLGEDCQREIF